jgi:hypothetical protein
VDIDVVIGANQKYDAYWKRIKAEFDEGKYVWQGLCHDANEEEPKASYK